MPEISRLPAFDAMLPAIKDDEEDERAQARGIPAARLRE
jgi:hypothetical protein